MFSIKDKIIFITKDILLPEYLKPYGSLFWETPNINMLARKGTIFRRHYSAAPSTAMAFTCMFTGLNPYETDRKDYVPVPPFTLCETLFDKMEERGYQCHIIWSEKQTPQLSNCYGKNPKYHYYPNRQSVGPHNPIDGDEIERNDEESETALSVIINEVDKSLEDGNVFVWIHLPHVIKGRTGYGDDIDLFDRLIGMIRERFDDNCIYISADHGHMNITKNKCAYGYDVYEDAIRIPLITPRIGKYEEVTFPTSNVQIKDIIADENLKELEYIYSDTAYYQQAHRKLAIIKGRYKYIFNKIGNNEELYDVVFDPQEKVNLLEKLIYDVDRQRMYVLNQIYFYPYYEDAQVALEEFRNQKKAIWKNGKWYINLWKRAKQKIKHMYMFIKVYTRLNKKP